MRGETRARCSARSRSRARQRPPSRPTSATVATRHRRRSGSTSARQADAVAELDGGAHVCRSRRASRADRSQDPHEPAGTAELDALAGGAPSASSTSIGSTRGGTGGLDQLLAMLDDPSWTVRRAVVAALAALGTPAVAPLVERAARRSATTRRASPPRSTRCRRVDGDADAALIALLADAPGRRCSPTSPRSWAGAAARSACRRWSPCSRHADDNVAVAAIEALGPHRRPRPPSIRCVERGRTAATSSATFPAIDVLGRSGDPRAVAPLTRAARPAAATPPRRPGRSAAPASWRPVAPLVALPRARGAAPRCASPRSRWAISTRRHRERFGHAGAVDQAHPRRGGRCRRGAPADARARRRRSAEKAAICVVLGCAARVRDGRRALTGLLDASPSVADAAAARAAGVSAPRPTRRSCAASATGRQRSRRALLPLVTRATGTREIAQLPDRSPIPTSAPPPATRWHGSASPPWWARCSSCSPTRTRASSHAAVAAIQSLGSRETERLALDRGAAPPIRACAAPPSASSPTSARSARSTQLLAALRRSRRARARQRHRRAAVHRRPARARGAAGGAPERRPSGPAPPPCAPRPVQRRPARRPPYLLRGLDDATPGCATTPVSRWAGWRTRPPPRRSSACSPIRPARSASRRSRRCLT